MTICGVLRLRLRVRSVSLLLLIQKVSACNSWFYIIMFHNTLWCTTDMYFCIYAFIQYLLRETTEITLVQNLRRKFREMLQLNTIRSILKVEVAKENHCNNNLSALRICIIINLLLVFVAVSSAANNADSLFIPDVALSSLSVLHHVFLLQFETLLAASSVVSFFTRPATCN